jgi:hypothetical protein
MCLFVVHSLYHHHHHHRHHEFRHNTQKDSHGFATTPSKAQRPYIARVPGWVSMVLLVDGGVVESFTDSATDMARDSPKQVRCQRSFFADHPLCSLFFGISCVAS